jgi:hypothetical protein
MNLKRTLLSAVVAASAITAASLATTSDASAHGWSFSGFRHHHYHNHPYGWRYGQFYRFYHVRYNSCLRLTRSGVINICAISYVR